MNRENNFDLLRLLFAIIVFLVHSAVLTQNPQLAWLGQYLNSEIAVDGFFVISGFLILMSYEKSRSLSDYALKRCRRIYPAYFTVILLCALGGVLISTYSLSAYFNGAWLRYLISNLSFLNFLQPDLPGLFQNQYTSTVNGALWTIKIEVLFYLMLPLLAWLCRRYQPLLILSALYLSSLLWSQYCLQTNKLELARQLPGQLSYFAVGMFCYYYFDWLKSQRGKLALILGAAGLIALSYSLGPLKPLMLGLAVIYLGCFWVYLGNFSIRGDFSYGVYIFHFPTLQVFVHFGLFNNHPSLMLGVCALTILSLAYLSWHLIEKRWLGRGSHYLGLGTEGSAALASNISLGIP